MRVRREGSLGYFEVLMEEMNDKFSLVLEGHAAIRKEFNEKIDGIQEQQQLFMSLLKGSHDVLKEEIHALDRKLTGEIRAVDKRSEERDASVEARLTGEIRVVGDKVDGQF